MNPPNFAPPSPRTRVRRLAKQANYDPRVVYDIIDEAYLCHIAFQDEKGIHCLPMACWRQADYLYIHGANGSRLMKQLASGQQSAVSLCHLDGLVLARSAFNHAMNYRAAVIYGQFERVISEADKRLALDAFMDKIAPGRNAEIRQGSKKEFAATTVLRLSLAEAVTKIRQGGPSDDEADLILPVWAGVLPFEMVRLSPEAAEGITLAVPASLTRAK